MTYQHRKRVPIPLPRGMVDLNLVSGVDIVDKDGRVVLSRENGEPLMFLVPGDFGGLYTDEPLKIARQFSRMVIDLANGRPVDVPDWLPEDSED